MRWGKRHYHHESYLTRKKAASKRRLKAKLIPGYGKHRKYDFKQWQNRVYQRRYRRYTYPSQSERLRAWGEGYSRPRKRYSRVFKPTTQTHRPRHKIGTKNSQQNQAQYQQLSHETWKNILGWSFTISVFGSLWQYGFYHFFAGFWWIFILCIIVGWVIEVCKQAPNPEKQSKEPKKSYPAKTNSNSNSRARSSSSKSSVSQKSVASAKPLSTSSKSSSASTMTTTVTIKFNTNVGQSSDAEIPSHRSNVSLEFSSLSEEVSSASSAAVSNINYNTISTDCKLEDYSDDIHYHGIKSLKNQLSRAKSAQASTANASANSILDSLSKSSKFNWYKAYKVASRNYSIQDRDADIAKPDHPQVDKAMRIRNSLASGNDSYNASVLSSEMSSTNQSVEYERKSMEERYHNK